SKKSRLLLISILIIGIILSLFFLPHKVIDRIRYTFIPLPGDERATVHIFGVSLGPSASARIKSYREVLQQWKKTPVWGYGVTALGFVDSQYVRTLVELGVVGFIAFIVLLRSIFKNTLRIYRTSQDALFKGLALGFLAGHIGIIFHAMTANSFIIIRIMEPYWFLAAMVMAIPKLEGIDMTVAVPADGRKRNYFRNAIHLLVYGRTT
ncbi:MAG: hypothetical protein KKH94_00840, partial [Candidatus Omnitrophica bacterium]|nr:hypothetical protein [Candidatus Omnitrophota bacterium]